jgi:hypothetical protein
MQQHSDAVVSGGAATICQGVRRHGLMYAAPEGEVAGVLTLHHLLRAQQTAADAASADSI